LRKAKIEGLDAKVFLDQNDSYNFFKPLGQLIKTGATETNVNDYRVFIITPEASRE
jgi:hydroxypyruvate reductase